jgi:hypothetical protein
MSKQSRLLAIDASVLRSAGAKEGHSSHCAALLSSVLEIGHRAAFSSEIKAEWDKHQSRLAFKWRAAMVARKQMVPLNAQALQVCQHAIMARITAHASLGGPDRAALEKDAHMLAAAVEADRVIVTGDRILKILTDGALGLSLEWLLVHQDDSATEREQLINRVLELSRNKPNPPLPA